MRRGLGVVLFTLIAARVDATPIAYSFTGTLSGNTRVTHYSTLTNADGTVVDLSYAAFTATGIAEQRLFVTEGFFGFYAATTTYDFGALGSFTTNPNEDIYVTGTTRVGLERWAAGSPSFGGFEVTIAPATAFVGPFAIGDFTPLRTLMEDQRTLRNAAGQVLVLGADGGSIFQTSIVITAASAHEVPEPAPGLLVLLGALIIGGLKRHSDTLRSRT